MFCADRDLGQVPPGIHGRSDLGLSKLLVAGEVALVAGHTRDCSRDPQARQEC